jgi:dihydroxyacetone kinase
VEPEVGELCTSFDMAGVSLTLFWLDDELERFWRAPAEAPGYRKGGIAMLPASETILASAPGADERPARGASASRRVAAIAVAAFEAIAAAIEAQVDELGRLDAVAGDGDHGLGMERGSKAALAAAHAALEQGAGLGSVVAGAGAAWADRAGGASGALWGLALQALGGALGDSVVPDAVRVSQGVSAALDVVMRSGKARVGDKTMIDAFAPFSETLRVAVDQQASLADAWVSAVAAAEQGAEQTAQLEPRIGRARPHGRRSIGHKDPGAVSFALVVRATQEAIASVHRGSASEAPT